MELYMVDELERTVGRLEGSIDGLNRTLTRLADGQDDLKGEIRDHRKEFADHDKESAVFRVKLLQVEEQLPSMWKKIRDLETWKSNIMLVISMVGMISSLVGTVIWHWIEEIW